MAAPETFGPASGSRPAPDLNPYEDSRFLAAFPGGLRPGGLDLTREALDFCRFPPGAFLADAGCGAGVTLEYLLQQGYRGLGLDQSDRLLKMAARKGPVKKASLEALPLKDQEADGLLCECVFSLAGDKPRVLAEFRRVLKTGGRLILSDLFIPGDWRPGRSRSPSGGPGRSGSRVREPDQSGRPIGTEDQSSRLSPAGGPFVRIPLLREPDEKNRPWRGSRKKKSRPAGCQGRNPGPAPPGRSAM
ncbi:MAG: class I SAM-dependent methyltransferase, partial [Deltaproteobacteria bacterium]|nr:class I SAM-dependent methyltransferase [Deltaproteobacteria bacterium]